MSLNLSNNEIGFFNDIYMLKNTGQSSIYDIFGSKTDISNLGGLDTTTLSNITSTITGLSTLNSALATKATITSVSDLTTALADKANTITLNNFMSNTNNTLATKAPLNNASFTGNTGINLSVSDTLDSALYIKGQRNVNPTTEGMRFGWSDQVYYGTGRSYGIEICSQNLAASTIDFTYPNGSNSYYAGRIAYDNNQGAMYFYANSAPSTSETLTDNWGMYLRPNGELWVKNQLITNDIYLTSGPTGAIGNLVSKLSGYDTSLTNINNTIPSLITGSTLTSNLSSYSTITTVSNLSTYFETNSLLVSGNSTMMGTLTSAGNYSTSNITATGNLYIQSASSPSGIFVTNTISGISGIYLITNTTMQSRISQDPTGNVVWRVNMSVNSQLPFRLSSLGFVDISNGNKTNNKMLVLSEYGASDLTLNATNFSGLGINASTLRYQVPDNWSHKFYAGSSSLFEVNKTSLSLLGNLTASGQTHIMNATAEGDDVSLTLRNYASGSSSLYLYSNTTVASRIYQDTVGRLNIAVNISGTSVLPLSLYSNGVVNVNSSNGFTNKILVLYDNGTSDAPSTAVNYSGIGTQSGGALRYQVPTATSTHRFFCGTTQSFFITNGSGASGSDSRWKSDVQNITNALDKVKQLQGKTFVYNNCNGRQMGLIAQDVQPIVSEVVIENDGYYLLCYDRLVALLIESIKELEQRVSVLEGA